MAALLPVETASQTAMESIYKALVHCTAQEGKRDAGAGVLHFAVWSLPFPDSCSAFSEMGRQGTPLFWKILQRGINPGGAKRKKASNWARSAIRPVLNSLPSETALDITEPVPCSL